MRGHGYNVIISSVAVPGSGAFLTPGSGMGKKPRSGFGIWDEHPGSYFRELGNNLFGWKYLNSLVRIRNLFDPGSGMEKFGGTRDRKIRSRNPKKTSRIRNTYNENPNTGKLGGSVSDTWEKVAFPQNKFTRYSMRKRFFPPAGLCTCFCKNGALECRFFPGLRETASDWRLAWTWSEEGPGTPSSFWFTKDWAGLTT